MNDQNWFVWEDLRRRTPDAEDRCRLLWLEQYAKTQLTSEEHADYMEAINHPLGRRIDSLQMATKAFSYFIKKRRSS
jgi:hypothetical protein